MRFLKKTAPLFVLGFIFCLPFTARAGSTTDRVRPEASLVHEPVADDDTPQANEEQRAPSSMRDPVISNGEGAQASPDMHIFRDRHWY
jgi:hypothetical protein